MWSLHTIFCSKEPIKNEKQTKTNYNGSISKRIKKFLLTAVYNPFKDFTQRTNWALILLFIFLYRMSDAYMGPMAYPFYDDMGFSKIEIAYVSKIYGMIATIAGGIAGGLIINRFGIMRSLLWFGILQGITNMMFVAQSYAGHNIWLLTVTISLDNISAGMGTTALVAYLSSLCNIAYTATQYALLSSLMSFARDVFAATSGFLADHVSWDVFFLITSLMVIPGLVLLIYLMKKHPQI